MASRTSSKRLLSCIILSCEEAEYYATVLLVDPKAGTGAGAIQRFELVDEHTPSKRGPWSKRAQPIINAKWSPSALASTKSSKFLVRSGAGWRDGDEYFRCLAKEQRPWWPEWMKKYWAIKQYSRWRRATKIDFLKLPAEIRNRVYSMVFQAHEVRPFKYRNDPPVRTMWTFFARPWRRSAPELMRVNRQVYQESTYMLYRFSSFWFSEMPSLTNFVNSISPANLALVRTVRLRLGAEELFDAFQANFSAAYLSHRLYDLDHVVSLWNLDHLIIEFPYGFQLQPPWTPPFGVCTVVWCKWIVKAVMDYCSARAVAKRVDFIGGPGFLPEEQRALAEVKLMHSSMSYNDMDIMNTTVLNKDTVKATGLDIWVGRGAGGHEPKVDVIAAQGLGVHSYNTWVRKHGRQKNADAYVLSDID